MLFIYTFYFTEVETDNGKRSDVEKREERRQLHKLASYKYFFRQLVLLKNL